jgi:hypothetical protein
MTLGKTWRVRRRREREERYEIVGHNYDPQTKTTPPLY